MVSIEPLDMGFAGMASKVQGVGAWSQRTASRPKGRQAIAARMLVSDRELTTRRQKLFYLCGRVVRDLMGGKQTDWWNKWEIRRRVMRRKAETKKESGNRLGPEKIFLLNYHYSASLLLRPHLPLHLSLLRSRLSCLH